MNARRLAPALALAALLAAPAPAQDRAPAVDDTWEPIFDGKSLKGWQAVKSEFFTVEDGLVHVRFPADANWSKGMGKDGNAFLQSPRSYNHFAVSLEVKLDRGMFGIGQWGTLKQYFDSNYLGPRWRQIVMVFRSGANDVRLYVDGYRQQFSGTPDKGDNTNPLLLFFRQDCEVWIRNVRVKTLAKNDPFPGTPDPAAAGSGSGTGAANPGADAPKDLTLLPGFEREWEHEGAWSLAGGVLSATAGRTKIWARTSLRTADDGVLTFSYRGLGSSRSFAVLVDLPNFGLGGLSIPLPLPASGWQGVEVRLEGKTWTLLVDGRETKKGSRRGEGGGLGFTLADGGAVEIKDMEFKAAR